MVCPNGNGDREERGGLWAEAREMRKIAGR